MCSFCDIHTFSEKAWPGIEKYGRFLCSSTEFSACTAHNVPRQGGVIYYQDGASRCWFSRDGEGRCGPAYRRLREKVEGISRLRWKTGKHLTSLGTCWRLTHGSRNDQPVSAINPNITWSIFSPPSSLCSQIGSWPSCIWECRYTGWYVWV